MPDGSFGWVEDMIVRLMLLALLCAVPLLPLAGASPDEPCNPEALCVLQSIPCPPQVQMLPICGCDFSTIGNQEDYVGFAYDCVMGL